MNKPSGNTTLKNLPRISKLNNPTAVKQFEVEEIYTVNLCLVTFKYKNTSRNITVPQKYVFDFKE
jgi:hypothetical protein